MFINWENYYLTFLIAHTNWFTRATKQIFNANIYKSNKLYRILLHIQKTNEHTHFFKCFFHEYYKWKIYLNISLNTPEVNVHNNLTWHELLIFIGIKTILYTCILRDVIFLSHFTTVRYWNFLFIYCITW